ncbi:MAG: hypothetical protein RMJ35_11535, partial [Phycisphaerales bacterium]|nr:hypothetical protein [Phycisphaerales bacterium]
RVPGEPRAVRAPIDNLLPEINNVGVDFTDCQPALVAATVMNAFERPWCIAGGWAIDLWLGRLTRSHRDVQVAILRQDQIALRDFLSTWRFFVVTPRGMTPWRREDRQMLMLPVHELRAADARGRQLGFLLNECDSVDWLFGRDQRIRWPLDQWIITGAFGVPVLAPNIVLLYKSQAPRAWDELDLRSSLPALAPELKDWLADAIRLMRDDHPWLAALGGGSG